MTYTKKLFIFLSIVMLFSITHSAYALKQAIFPSSQSLQPIPENVHPNISGNTNNSTSDIPISDFDLGQQVNQQDNQPTQNSSPTPEVGQLLMWPFLMGLIIAIFIVYRKVYRNKKTN